MCGSAAAKSATAQADVLGYASYYASASNWLAQCCTAEGTKGSPILRPAATTVNTPAEIPAAVAVLLPLPH
jgi:hypothetical protein